MVAAINAAKIPSYSFAAVADVERGLLATNTEPRDIDRQARLNALNMQAVMLGEAPEISRRIIRQRQADDQHGHGADDWSVAQLSDT